MEELPHRPCWPDNRLSLDEYNQRKWSATAQELNKLTSCDAFKTWGSARSGANGGSSMLWTAAKVVVLMLFVAATVRIPVGYSVERRTPEDAPPVATKEVLQQQQYPGASEVGLKKALEEKEKALEELHQGLESVKAEKERLALESTSLAADADSLVERLRAENQDAEGRLAASSKSLAASEHQREALERSLESVQNQLRSHKDTPEKEHEADGGDLPWLSVAMDSSGALLWVAIVCAFAALSFAVAAGSRLSELTTKQEEEIAKLSSTVAAPRPREQQQEERAERLAKKLSDAEEMISQLQSRAARLQGELDESRIAAGDAEALRSKAARLQEAAGTKDAELTSLRLRLDEAQRLKVEAEDAAEEAQGRLKKMLEEAEGAQDSAVRSSGELAASRAEVAALREQLETAQGIVEEVSSARLRAAAGLEESQGCLEAQKEEHTRLLGVLDKCHQKLQSVLSSAGSASKGIQTASEGLEGLEQTVREAEESIRALLTERTASLALAEETAAREAAAVRRLRQVEEALAAHEEGVEMEGADITERIEKQLEAKECLAAKLDEVVGTNTKVVEDLDAATAQIEAKQREIDELQGCLEDRRRQIANSEERFKAMETDVERLQMDVGQLSMQLEDAEGLLKAEKKEAARLRSYAADEGGSDTSSPGLSNLRQQPPADLVQRRRSLHLEEQVEQLEDNLVALNQQNSDLSAQLQQAREELNDYQLQAQGELLRRPELFSPEPPSPWMVPSSHDVPLAPGSCSGHSAITDTETFCFEAENEVNRCEAEEDALSENCDPNLRRARLHNVQQEKQEVLRSYEDMFRSQTGEEW